MERMFVSSLENTRSIYCKESGEGRNFATLRKRILLLLTAFRKSAKVILHYIIHSKNIT